ncbi:unnamed protein product, partial [Urochloa humidicola]
ARACCPCGSGEAGLRWEILRVRWKPLAGRCPWPASCGRWMRTRGPWASIFPTTPPMTTREAASDRRSRRGYLRPSAPNCEATREAAAAVPSLCLPPRGAGRRLQHAGPGLPPETCNPQQSNQRHEAAGAPAPNIHLHEDATVEAPPHAWPCGAQGYNSFLGGTCSTKCSNVRTGCMMMNYSILMAMACR